MYFLVLSIFPFLYLHGLINILILRWLIVFLSIHPSTTPLVIFSMYVCIYSCGYICVDSCTHAHGIQRLTLDVFISVHLGFSWGRVFFVFLDTGSLDEAGAHQIG